MSRTNILNLTRGIINTVNDAAIGQSVADAVVGASQYTGQLGKYIELDDNEILFDSTVGTVYGGRFRYVRLDPAAGVPVVGQLLFWTGIAAFATNLWTVTTSETAGSTDNAEMIAGVCLSKNLTPGNYTLIQDVGPTFVKFRAVLTAAGNIGVRCYAAGVGPGADLGLADVWGAANPATDGDVSLQLGRYLGKAIDAPTNGGLKRVDLSFHNLRG